MWFLSEREHKASPVSRIGKPTDLFDLISGRQDSLRNDEYNRVNDGVTDRKIPRSPGEWLASTCFCIGAIWPQEESSEAVAFIPLRQSHIRTMTIYRTVEDLRGLRGWTRFIERVQPGEETIRFAFKGTAQEAEAEAAGLTSLLSTRLP